MPAYADGHDLTDRYDIDLVGDLATDDRNTQDRDSVPTNPKVLTALQDASGEVDAALLTGGRYTVDQLQSLTDNALSYLKSIVCGLAIASLHRRNPESVDPDYIRDITKDAREALTRLRNGVNVFGLADEIAAGVIDTGGPTVLGLEARNDLTVRMGRAFPAPYTRLPRGR